MKRQNTITIAILMIIPFIGYALIKYVDYSWISFINIEVLVGIIAILSGLTGIFMGISSAKQASLDAVKEYFQQGDNAEHVAARQFINDKKHLNVVAKPIEVSRIVNFFQMWGILNRKHFLPIWVFGGASGIRVVELYITLESWIDKGRLTNPFYAKEFELLAHRIYRKYKDNFKGSSLQNDYKDNYTKFTVKATSYKTILSTLRGD